MQFSLAMYNRDTLLFWTGSDWDTNFNNALGFKSRYQACTAIEWPERTNLFVIEQVQSALGKVLALHEGDGLPVVAT